jgi:hypothetical protein
MTEEHNDTTTVKVSMRDIYQEVQRQGKLLEKIAHHCRHRKVKLRTTKTAFGNWRTHVAGHWNLWFPGRNRQPVGSGDDTGEWGML